MIEFKPLPYSLNALEPVISARTLEFHHGKHLKAYVDNLNKLIAGTGFENLELETIILKAHNTLQDPESTQENLTLARSIFNNAGQVLNHNLYFEQFAPFKNDGDTGCISNLTEEMNLCKAIVNQWGSIENFKAEFVAKGVSLFGSGWVWLSSKKDGELIITQEAGASNPIIKGLKPLLTFDVWEHAYYLDYQNKRVEQLNALWSKLNWEIISKRYSGER